MRIEVHNLCKKYNQTPVLADVSMNISQPGVSALVGPNGSGKTTLMRILALLEDFDSGHIAIDDRESPKIRSRAAIKFRQRMVLVHNPAVMLSGSVGYNLGYGLRVRGLDGREYRDRLSDILQRFSLGGLESKEARDLSAGQRQRLALARAMAVDPEVYFLDEPTANLDPMSRRMIEQAIIDLGGRGRKVIIASHHLWEVERLASWIWFLVAGRMERSGPARQLLHNADHRLWSVFWGQDNLYTGWIEREKGAAVFRAGQTWFEVVSDLEGRAQASIDPAEVILSRRPLPSSARNVKPGRVMEIAAESGIYRVKIDIGLPLVAMVTKASGHALKLKTGSKVYAIFKASAVRVWQEEL